MNYSFVDPNENVGLPKPMSYAGLYSSDVPYTNTLWAKEYRGAHIPPDAVAYASQYNELAKSHIVSSIRPGNNEIINNPYRFNNDKLNSMCYSK